MSQKIAVLFTSREVTDSAEQFTSGPDYTYYALSVRGGNVLRLGVHIGKPGRSSRPNAAVEIRQTQYSRYDEIKARSWREAWNDGNKFNYDASLTHILQEPSSLAQLFFPVEDASELWMFKHFLPGDWITRAEALGVTHRNLKYRMSWMRSDHIQPVLRFQGKSQFTAMFGSTLEYWPLDALFLGVTGDGVVLSPLFESLSLHSEVSLFGGVITGGNISEYFDASTALEKCWCYSIKSDAATFHDVPDPIYCMPNREATQFERKVATLVTELGYKLFVLPMREAIVSNWLGIGELPIISPLSNQREYKESTDRLGEAGEYRLQ